MDIVFACGGCLIFSGYVVYDTYMITKRLSPDEYIMAAISLYLEYVDLRFVYPSISNSVISLASSISVSITSYSATSSLTRIAVINILRLLNDLQDR